MRGQFEICPLAGGSSTVTGAPTEIIGRNLKRKRLVMYTLGSVDVWISEGGTPVVGEGIVLRANGGSSMTWDYGCNLFTGKVFGISADGSPAVVSYREAI